MRHRCSAHVAIACFARLFESCVCVDPDDSECRALELPDDPGEQMHTIPRPHDFYLLRQVIRFLNPKNNEKMAFAKDM